MLSLISTTLETVLPMTFDAGGIVILVINFSTRTSSAIGLRDGSILGKIKTVYTKAIEVVIIPGSIKSNVSI